MHIKFIKPKSPVAQAVIDYVLRTGKKPDPNETVTVLRGNPQQVATVADSLDYKQKYSSAVIAWHKDDAPTPDQINEVLNDFERLAFAGLDTQQYTLAAVQHEEKDGSKHVHIIVPFCDLINDKSLNIAPPKHQETYDTLRDFHNAKNGWKSPDIEANPSNARTIQLSNNRGTRKNLMLALDTFVTNSILSGHITNRETLLKEIETAGRELGLEIVNTSKESITIKTADMKQGMRLKGEIYEQNFDISTDGKLAEYVRRQAGADAGSEAKAQTDTQRNIEQLTQRFSEAVERRAEYHAKRHPNPFKQADEANGITSSTQAHTTGLDGGSLSSVMPSNLLAGMGIDTAQNDHSAGLSNSPNKQQQNDDMQRKRMATRTGQHYQTDAELIAQQIAKLLEAIAKMFGFNANFTGVQSDRNRNKAYEIIEQSKRANESGAVKFRKIDSIISERTRRNSERAIEAKEIDAENEHAFAASVEHAERLIVNFEEQQRQEREQQQQEQEQSMHMAMGMEMKPTADWFKGAKR